MIKSLSLLMALTLSCPLPAWSANVTKSGGAAAHAQKAATETHQKLLASPVYQEATKLFQGKQYSEALKKFQTLDATGFQCDLVEYYIAQCFQKTNQLTPALQHYKWVSANSKDPKLRSYADYAMQGITHYAAHRTVEGQGNVFVKNPGRHGHR